jgi:hypothetical protein
MKKAREGSARGDSSFFRVTSPYFKDKLLAPNKINIVNLYWLKYVNCRSNLAKKNPSQNEGFYTVNWMLTTC